MWVAAFDIDAKDRASFNRRKRLFYYHLSRIPHEVLSRSVVAVEDREALEALFRKVGGIRVVWVKAEDVEEVEY